MLLLCIALHTVTEAAKTAPGGEAYNPEEPSIGLTDTGKKATSWASSQETTNISNHSKDKFGATKFYPPASITGNPDSWLLESYPYSLLYILLLFYSID